MAKQPLKKKEGGKRNTISDFKAKLGLNISSASNKGGLNASNADKPMEWLIMPQAYQDALKLPGIPMGYISTIIGHSNTGKSTLVNHAIVAAQRQGLIPVIYDTENNFDFKYAMDMGMEAEPVYDDVEVETVDPETGEVTVTTENRIVAYDGNFIYFNNAILAERYGKMDYNSGKETSKLRPDAVVEDVAYSINELLKAQYDGDIENGFVFLWDSVGSLECYKAYCSSTNNAMWTASAISVAFNNIVNDRIPRSRKISSPYTNTLIFVNKIWLDSMSSPVGPPSISLKGGNSIWYSTRLMILLGGQIKASTKKLTAETKGTKYNWGIQAKIKTMKNQLPSPWTVTYEGEVICSPHGMISIEKDSIDIYKKEHLSDILKTMREMSNQSTTPEEINESDITFTEEEGVD